MKKISLNGFEREQVKQKCGFTLMYVSDFIKHFLKNFPFGHSLVVMPLAPRMT